MIRFVEANVSSLVQEFITSVRQKQCNLLALCNSKKQFLNFPSALYSTEDKFHHTYCPHGNQMESKLYYSGKHHLYGYKIQVSVSPLGYAIHASKHFPGSVANVTIFRIEMENHSLVYHKQKRLEWHIWRRWYRERAQTLEYVFDKGYTSAHRDVRAIIPKKKKAQDNHCQEWKRKEMRKYLVTKLLWKTGLEN